MLWEKRAKFCFHRYTCFLRKSDFKPRRRPCKNPSSVEVDVKTCIGFSRTSMQPTSLKKLMNTGGSLNSKYCLLLFKICRFSVSAIWFIYLYVMKMDSKTCFLLQIPASDSPQTAVHNNTLPSMPSSTNFGVWVFQ